MKLIWQAEEVLRAVRGQCLHEQSWTATGVAIDSRTVKPGDLFVALKGPTHDAHDFAGQAFAAGAVAAIVQRAPSQVPPDAPLLFVDDVFAALQDLGRVGRQRSAATVLAVTGSVGKTGCKEQLRVMLECCGDAYANEGSFNNHWGVPLSLARLPADAQYGVFEIGMNHAGELGPLSREVQPRVSLITNIEAVHLEFFASVEAIADAKAEIFLGMTPDGVAVLNRDNPHYGRLLAAARTQGLKRIVGFGRDAKADARLLDYSACDDGGKVVAEILGQKFTYRIGAAGAHVAFNSLGTLLAATMAGADTLTCAEALASYRTPSGRGTRQNVALHDGGAFALIDESYNASPVAVRAAVRLLGETAPATGGRRVAVLGDMRELGDAAPRLHMELAAAIVESGIDRVHCCGGMMGYLYENLPAALRGKYAQRSADLAPLVAAEIRNGDVVMVKGSKSTAMHLVVDALKALQDGDSRRKIAG